MYLHNLLLSNGKHGEAARDALLWLMRALKMIERFFTNVAKDETREENLKSHFQSAYDETLMQYHNYFIRKLFSVD